MGVIVQGPLELVPDSELHRQFDVNVFGPIRVIRAALPLLRGGGGRIVNLGAPTAYLPMPLNAPISSSKAALHSISTALRTELAAWGIPVSLVVPGLLDTAIFAKAAAAQEAAEVDPDRAGLYREHLAAVDEAAAKQKPRPVDGVAEAIVRAVTAGKPKARYLPTSDARMIAGLAAMLPARMREGLVARMLGVRGIKAPDAMRQAA